MSAALPSVAATSAPRGPTTSDDQPAVDVLRRLILGDESESLFVRDRVRELGDRPDPEGGWAARIRTGYALFQQLSRALGGGRRIAADIELGTMLCEWSAQLAPHVLPAMTGHYDLTIAAIERLGNNSAYQRECLTELDNADAIGVMALTELGYGTNTIGLETQAIWHPAPGHVDGGWLTLHTPTPAAVKMPPNVGTPTVAKTVIVIARLLVRDRDEGVWPFLLRLRTQNGLTDGVTVVELPESRYGPVMDHAAIAFDQVRIPRDALLCGSLARLDHNGFHCDLDTHSRFMAAIGGLVSGRIKLGCAATASARAALALTVGYAHRRMAGRRTMLELDNVQQDLVSATAASYAMTALGREVVHRYTQGDPAVPVLAMLAKPLMTYTAHSVLETCRQRLGAQGMYPANYVAAYIANTNGMITAEGENQSLLVAAGDRLASSPTRRPGSLEPAQIQVMDPSAEMPWWQQMLHRREQMLTIDPADRESPTGVLGPKSAAIERAVAVAERLAVDALALAAQRIGDRSTRATVDNLTAIYALNSVRAHADWYAAHNLYSRESATAVHEELVRRTALTAPHLPRLTAAFAVPELRAPIDTRSLKDDAAGYPDAWISHLGLRPLFEDQGTPMHDLDRPRNS